jgi:hypothetical protein
MFRRVTGEIQVLAQELSWILQEVATCLRGLNEEQLNWQPSSPDSNSSFAIAHHIVGSSRVYVIGFGCGLPVSRDRSAEFTACGASAEGALTELDRLADDIRAALASLRPEVLDQRLLPSRELWGTGEIREITRREALVQAVRHAALHLGELRLTRSLALSSPKH